MTAAIDPPTSSPPADSFARRHIGPGPDEIAAMLGVLGFASLDALIDAAVPAAVRRRGLLQNLPPARSEAELLAELRAMMGQNQVYRSYLGGGYHDSITPPVIQRNILENPGWYTAYTPYQAEISQGRLEALLNFQTMISDLTGLAIANASLLDEATAAAEAMTLCRRLHDEPARPVFFVSATCHPQTIAVVRTRATPLGIEVVVGDHRKIPGDARLFGVLLQYPATDGAIDDYQPVIRQVHDQKALVVVAADLLGLTLLTPPGEFGADVAVGSTQRFGVPLGCGGPHAAYFATRDAFKRQMPGRLVGVSKDAQGRPALRLALQTREQHIRRDKATSNICTAQVLPAILAAMYAVWHGPEGLKRIAQRIHFLTRTLAAGLRQLGYALGEQPFFDTLRVRVPPGRQSSAPPSHDGRASFQRDGPVANEIRSYEDILAAARAQRMNLRRYDDGSLGITLDETTGQQDVRDLLRVFGAGDDGAPAAAPAVIPTGLARATPFLGHAVFQRYHTEQELLRYLKRLEARDLSLTTGMIPLGSCTMKLNATAEMMPLSWPEVARIHPFAPRDQTRGYQKLFQQLAAALAEITGFAAVSLQPNAGSQGEYAGLLAIRAYHQQRGEPHRDICLIPVSAHGTNPASATLAGLKVAVVACDNRGNIDLADLRRQAVAHAANLAALMVTYPSTHGVFEETILAACAIVHQHGGQVYLDGANLNALVGLCRPADLGADVCHLNLHKTFCIPHGGGGPGMGPIGVAGHLAPFLPTHPLLAQERQEAGPVCGVGPVAAAPWGSASILTVSWMYLGLMGAAGLEAATKTAILNANYIARRLDPYFPVLYKGATGLVAHECILALGDWKARAGLEVEDVAKRLMDYGFHAPTMSWPVPGTLMVEPTESEAKAELDRFCEAMIAIHAEMTAVESGQADRQDNLLKNAPHTAQAVTADPWTHPYSRAAAAFPSPATQDHKFWPAVGRIDNVHGDRHLVCACPPLDAYSERV